MWIPWLCRIIFPRPPGQTRMCSYVRVPLLYLQNGHSNESVIAENDGYCAGDGNPTGSGWEANVRMHMSKENSSDDSVNCVSVGSAMNTQAAPGEDWERNWALFSVFCRSEYILFLLNLERAVEAVACEILVLDDKNSRDLSLIPVMLENDSNALIRSFFAKQFSIM